MGCIDIKYKNYHIKITNGVVESEVFNTSDTDLLYQFITTGTLPEGYTIESDINIKSPNDVKAIFREIINDINAERNASDKYLEVQQFVLTPEFINKAAGNRDWATAMYDPYAYTHRIGLQNNCLYISGLGNKTTYGFTKDRPFKITGWSVQTPNIVDDTLLNSYINLLDNDLMVTNIVNKLYSKLNPDGASTDIFEKLTWLSNNQLKELISSLYIPRAITYDLNNTSIEELLKNANNVKGLGTKVNKKMYILTGKTDGGELEAFEISKTNDEKINIPKESIRHLYQTFEIYDTTGNYIILNKIWYKIEKGKYIRVDDKKLSDDLFNKWFGLIDDSEFETIDTGNKELNITLNHKTDNGPLSDVLPIGSYVRSAIGYYTKDIDGLFKNGDRVLSENEKIYKIFYKKQPLENNLLIDIIKTSIPYKNDSYTLSRNDALIILSEYGIENFADVWLDYDSNNSGEIIYSNKKNKILLHIGLNGNIEQTLENVRAFKLSTEFFKALNNNEVPPELASLSNVGFIFKYIKEGNFITDIVNLGKKGTMTLSNESINWIKNFVNSIDISETEWTDILDNNKDALSIWNDNIDSELDAKIEKYEKEGRITRMCSWK